MPDTEIEFVQLLQDMLGDSKARRSHRSEDFGDDQEQLNSLSEEIEQSRKIKGVVDVSARRRRARVDVAVDPAGAARLGLTVEQVGTQLSNAWLGQVATELRLFDRTIPVRVRFPDTSRFNVGRLPDTPIRGADGQLVPASSLVTITEQPGEPELKRENLRTMAIVTARLEGRDLGGAVEEIRKMLDGMHLPVGYTYEIGGQYDRSGRPSVNCCLSRDRDRSRLRHSS